MALDQNAQYPVGTIGPNVNYPEGEAVNSSAPGALNGYPWEKEAINDLLGFQQALLRAGGIAASGSADTAILSQYVKMISEIAAGRAVNYDDVGAVNAYALNVQPNQQAPDSLFDGLTVKYLPANTNTGASTANAFGTGVVNIKLQGGVTNPQASRIITGEECTLIYRTTPSAHWELATVRSIVNEFGLGASGTVVPDLADFATITNPSGFYRTFGAGTGSPTPNGPPTSGNNQMSAYVTNINGIVHYLVKENAPVADNQRLHIGNTQAGSVVWTEVPTEFVFTSQQSKATNGYQQLPGGLILQWGLATSIPNNGEKTITFPIAFPNAALNVVATLQQPNFVTGGWIIFIDTIAAANFVIGCDDVSSTAGTPNAYWYAIGH